jgi:hypothetical protein
MQIIDTEISGTRNTTETSEMHAKMQSENQKGRDNLGDLDVKGKLILKRDLEKYGVMM